MSRDNGDGRRIAILYTPVEDSLKDAPRAMKEAMDLAVSARLVAGALEAAGSLPRIFPFGRDIRELGGALADFGPDVVFNLSECPLNSAQKEPHAAAFLELLRFPYTGNGPAALALCNNKALTKQVLAAQGIATPRFRLYAASPRGRSGLSFPVIVKPAREDGSAGITEESIVDGEAPLRRRVAFVIGRYNQEALAEEFVGGREFNVAVLGNGTAEEPYRTLPPSELVYRSKKWRICSFESKWDVSHPSYADVVPICPARTTPGLERRLQRLALACARIFGLSGYSRVDLRLNGTGRPYVLEVNPNPDISPDAGLARAAKASGMSYEDLVQEIVRLGKVRGPR